MLHHILRPSDQTQKKILPNTDDSPLSSATLLKKKPSQDGITSQGKISIDSQKLFPTVQAPKYFKLMNQLSKYQEAIQQIAQSEGLDPYLLAGLIAQESAFNPNARSKMGAMGLGQLMPKTAEELGVKNPYNASENLSGSARYLKKQIDDFDGQTSLALAAYNAGPSRVKKAKGIPQIKETQNYVASVLKYTEWFRQMNIFSD